MVGTTTISQLIEEVVSRVNPEAFIVELILPEGKNHTLSLRVDTEKGISIGECALLSREIGPILEAENFYDSPWTLEVSSPGIGRPLTVNRQYRKNIGRLLKVKTKNGETHKGILKAVDEENITLSPAPPTGKPGAKKKTETQEEVNILITDIKEAKVQISMGN